MSERRLGEKTSTAVARRTTTEGADAVVVVGVDEQV
jgi:hypothetical protein